MECYDQDDGVAGNIPEFGAIFMSNPLTKKECFKRKIFALPSSRAEFVKHVKAGMVLFLFECKKRQLFGVFQASSDGSMDIVPHAFSYSGRHFPAQVCFTPIWYCDPLSEREFQDAIIENYFSAKKFNFGLSEDQVRKLLLLFSSRKMTKEMVPKPPVKAVIGVSGKDRRSTGDDSFELNERGYTEPTEEDEFNPAVFSDYYLNSSVKVDDVLVDVRVNTEGKVYPLVQGDSLSKRRRIDDDDRLLANDVEEIYNYGALRTSHNVSQRDSLDELRKSAAVRQVLTAERVRKEHQVDKIRHAILSSESVMDPLELRTAGDDRYMQRNRLFDEYYMDNGFASELYEKPLETSKHAVDDDRFLFDDCIHRNQDIRCVPQPMVCTDGNLNLCRQPMQVMEDHQSFFNRKLENRFQLDRDVNPFRAFEHKASLLHKTRETTSGGKFLVNDGMEYEPNSAEDLSSARFSRPLHSGNRIIYDRQYPIVEGRVTESMVGSTFGSATSNRNTGYFETAGDQVVDDGRFRKSEGVDNQNDVNARFGTGISLGYPSSCNQTQTLSLFSDKLLPENGLTQLHVAHRFGPSHTTFDDATITKSTPYSPVQPHFSHGFNASIAANQNSGVTRESPDHGSLEDFYLCKSRSSPCNLESKKSSRSLHIPSEFGNKGLPTNISSVCQRSLRHEATSSFRNSDLSMHLDLNTSDPVNHRGSVFSKSILARAATDLENIEEEGASFDYPSKSNGDHFAFDENLATTSKLKNKHVPRQKMDMLSNNDCSFSEAKDSTLGIYHRERDLTSYANQYIGISSTMNRQVKHKISGASHFDSDVSRKSVFSRLTSRKKFQGDEERDDESNVDCHDCYMDATADEVMEMLRHSNNPSPGKVKNTRVVGQSKHGESAFNEKKVRNHIEIKSSAMENRKMKDAHLPTTQGSIEEVPKKTPIMDYKRRSETKKNSIEASTDPATCDKIICAHEEVGNSRKTALKRRRLVRPVFGKTEPASGTVCSNKRKSQVPGQILENCDKQDCEKTVGFCEAEMPNDNTRLSDVSVLHTHQLKTHQSTDYYIKEHSIFEEQKDIASLVLPYSSTELKEHKTSSVGARVQKRECEKAVSLYEAEMPNDNTHFNSVLISHTHQSMDCNTKDHPSTEDQKDIAVHVLASSSTDLKGHKASIIGFHIGKRDCEESASICESEAQNDNIRLNDMLLSHIHQNMDCTTEEGSCLEEQKDIAGHVLPSSSTELKERKTLIVGAHIDERDCEKAANIYEPESRSDNTRLNDVLISFAHQSDCNTKEHSSSEETKDRAVHVFSSTELKGHETAIVGVHVGKRDCEESASICENETHNGNTWLNNLLISNTHRSMDCNKKEHLNPEEQKDIDVHVLPSSSTELKERKTSIAGIHIDKRECEKAASICGSKTRSGNTRLNDVLISHTNQSMDCNTKEHSSPEEQKDIAVHVFSSSSTELKGHETSIVGVHIDKRCCEESPSICESETHNDNTRLNVVLISHTHQSMDCNKKEHSSPEEQKDIAVRLLPSSSTELKEQEISVVGIHIDRSQALLTQTIQQKSVDNPTSVEDISSKNIDSTTRSLNLEESSSVGLELAAGCLNNVIMEKRPRMVKRKKKIIKKVIKTNKTGTKPSQ
ncbi:hypothetical protein OROMI_021937 [Orobanche minor]